MNIFGSKVPKWLIAVGIIYALVIWIIMVYSMSLEASDRITTTYSDFAVDSMGNIYMAENAEITVWDQNENLLRTIDPKTNRGYWITIKSDTLFVDNELGLYEMDLYVNIIEIHHSDEYEQTIFDRTSWIKSGKFAAEDGHVYVMGLKLLRPCVFRLDGKQRVKVHEMPQFDYMIRLLPVFATLCMVLIVGPGLLIRLIRKRKNARRANLP